MASTFTTTTRTGPIQLGKCQGQWAVMDDRTGSINVYTERAFAQRVFNNKVANLKHTVEGPLREAAPDAERDYLYEMRVAREWQMDVHREDRRTGTVGGLRR